jgi:hypothetical protein
MTEATQAGRLLGHVAWDGSAATSERVQLRTTVTNRRFVERNHYVRIQDEDGKRSGYVGRIMAGPFFHRAGRTQASGLDTNGSLESFLLAELEIQGEIVEGRTRDTNSRPAPGSSVYFLSPAEIAVLHGFGGDMLLGNLTGQDDLQIHLQSKNKSVLPRNLGIFGTVGAGKTNTAQVIIEEAARNGWAVIVVDVEGEYIDMDLASDEENLEDRRTWFGRPSVGLKDFHAFCPAGCSTDRKESEIFTLRLADFDPVVIGELLQVTFAERNALLDCIEYLQQRSRTRQATRDQETLQTLIDAKPDAKLPFTLQTLRERGNDRSSRTTESFDYAGIAAKLAWLLHAEAFDLVNTPSLDPMRMMTPGRVSVIDVSVANDVVKNMVTADLLRKAFALKMVKPDTPPTLLVIEEAHSFISKERAQSMQATLHMLRNVTRRGRKRWLAMAFVSQQPGHLPPEIFELCNTRIVHTLRSMHNLEAMMSTTGDVGRELWARCPLLGQGQAILSSTQLNRSVVMTVRPASCRRKFVK